MIPRKLSVNKRSPHYNEDGLKRVDKVFVDGVHIRDCYAYDMAAGWAMQLKNGLWQPKVYGAVTVTEKP